MDPTENSPQSVKPKRRLRRRRIRQDGEPSAVDLIEEGVHLLRQMPLGAWSVYLAGVVPFIVFFLFFWTEMASSGLAGQVLFPGSLGLAILFFWFKATQVYFARELRQTLHGRSEPGWTWLTWSRIFRRQMFWQSTGLVLVPIAFVLTLPFAWIFTFYQNLLIADPNEHESEGEVAAESWRLAKIWHEQNWILLSLLSAVFCLSFLNWLSLLFIGPFLLKTLLGLETVFSRAGIHLINSTSLIACVLLAYVTTDPLVKAVYVLRHHYCESRRSGADLLLRLRRSVTGSGVTKLGILFLSLALSPFILNQSTSLQAQSSDTGSILVEVDAEVLDESIDQVFQRREFVWRFPREEVEEKVEDDNEWLISMLETIERWMETVENWIEGLFGSDRDSRDSRKHGSGWEGFAGMGSFLSYLIIGVFVLLIIYLAVRAWQMYQPLDTVEGERETGVEIEPDLNEEDVPADLLPRNRWVEMARELNAKGEYRLALRAYFLAQLSALSSEGLIIIRRAKSNREYAREISRRAHEREGLLDIYRQQVRLFESIWYGERKTGPEEIDEMESHLIHTGVLS